MTQFHRTSRRPNRILHDFQVFKGYTDETMKTFGGPVMTHHEAHLLVRNDRERATPGLPSVYAIYRRSENRILQIFRAPEKECLPLAA
jgi:hypothetical protein